MSATWFRKGFIGMLVVVAIIAALFTALPPKPEAKTYRLTERELIQLAKGGSIDTITVYDDRLRVQTLDDVGYVVQTKRKTDVYRLLSDGGVSQEDIDYITIEDSPRSNSDWISLLISLAPLAIFGAIIYGMRRFSRINRSSSQAMAGTDSDLPSDTYLSDSGGSAYRLRPERFDESFRSNVRRTRISIALIMLIIGLTLLKGAIAAKVLLTLDSVLPAVVGVAFGLAVVATASRRSLEPSRRIWLSYRLELGDNMIKRSQMQMPYVEIPLQEVTSIEEEPGKGILICTSNSNVSIYAPSSLEGYEELKEKLGHWRPVASSKRISRLERLSLLLSALWTVSFAVAMLIDEPIVALLASLLFVSLVVRDIIYTQRSRNCSESIRRGAIASLFFVVILVLRMVALVLPMLRS